MARNAEPTVASLRPDAAAVAPERTSPSVNRALRLHHDSTSGKSSLVSVSKWGPEAIYAPPTLEAAQAYCRQLALGHYENFPVATFLLPRELRQPFFAVYAFCRWADDLGDEQPSPADALRLLGWWRNELRSCYAGQCRHPVYVALKPVIDAFDIPIDHFEALISAFEQDQTVREYDTFAQLTDYCTRSANPVGRLVLRLFRCDREPLAEWSNSICTGLQLANFWQDVGRDLNLGRIYLPQEDRLRFGYSDDDLRQRRTTPAFLSLMKCEVDRAREFLKHGRPLIEQLPPALQIDVELFLEGGLCVLRKIEAIEYRVWETRPRVRKLDFAGLIIKCVARRWGRRWFGSRPQSTVPRERATPS